jgi:hypothetical protein
VGGSPFFGHVHELPRFGLCESAVRRLLCALRTRVWLILVPPLLNPGVLESPVSAHICAGAGEVAGEGGSVSSERDSWFMGGLRRCVVEDWTCALDYPPASVLPVDAGYRPQHCHPRPSPASSVHACRCIAAFSGPLIELGQAARGRFITGGAMGTGRLG